MKLKNIVFSLGTVGYYSIFETRDFENDLISVSILETFPAFAIPMNTQMSTILLIPSSPQDIGTYFFTATIADNYGGSESGVFTIAVV